MLISSMNIFSNNRSSNTKNNLRVSSQSEVKSTETSTSTLGSTLDFSESQTPKTKVFHKVCLYHRNRIDFNFIWYDVNLICVCEA